MAVHLTAVLIYLGIILLIYRSIIKSLENRTLKKKDYIGTLLSGALPCTVCIIIFELLFDRFVPVSSDSIGGEILAAFMRAALIEEIFKCLFSFRAVKKHRPASRIEFMLLCGLIGAGYGLVEKIAYGGGIILIVNALLPLHVFFQFITGAELYKGNKAKAFLLPFLAHGIWDSLLAAAGWLMDMDGSFICQLLGIILMAVLVIGGVIMEIKLLKKMKAAA